MPKRFFTSFSIFSVTIPVIPSYCFLAFKLIFPKKKYLFLFNCSPFKYQFSGTSLHTDSCEGVASGVQYIKIAAGSPQQRMTNVHLLCWPAPAPWPVWWPAPPQTPPPPPRLTATLAAQVTLNWTPDQHTSLETGKQPKLVQKSATNRDTNEILNPLTIQKGFRS